MIFKKFLHIALAAMLLVSSTGFTVYEHYCMGKLVSTSISKHDSDSCCAKKMTRHKQGCCDDKVSLEQLDSDLFKSFDKASIYDISVDVFFTDSYMSIATLIESISFHPSIHYSDSSQDRQNSVWTESFLL